MAAVTADSVAVEFLARSTKYEADLDRIYAKTKKTIDDLNKLTAKPVQVNAGAAATEAAETKKRASRKKTVDDDVKATEAGEAKKRAAQKATDDGREEASRRRLASLDRQIQEENRKLDNQSRTNRARAESDWRANMAAQRSALQGGTSLGSRTQPVTNRGTTFADVRSDLGEAMARSRLAATAGDRAAAQALRDQQLTLRLINQYKAQGLSATEALARAEREVGRAAAQRAKQEAAAARAKEQATRKQMEAALRQNQASVGSGIRNAAIGIAGGIGIAEISALNDKYIEFTNRLKIAGVEGSNFAVVQERLSATANKNGVDLVSLAGVFQKATEAGKEFGSTQAQNLQFTDAVSNAVRIQGGGVEKARGALLQLGQALQEGTVRAQEFNSLLEGLYPLLQAAASSSDKYGGSVAKLRAAVVEGKVSSEEFFNLILKGSDILEKRAAVSTLTTAAGFQALTNALVIYFGEADKANGVSAALGEALGTLAQNLDAVIPAIATIAIAMGGQYAVAAIRGAAATREMSVAALGLRTALSALQTVGIAAVIGALGSLVAEGINAQNALESTARIADEFGVTLSNTSKAALAAGNGTAGVGSAARQAEPEIWSFKNASSALTEQLYEQAKAARAARIETLNSQLAEVNRNFDTGANATFEGARRNSRAAFSALGRGDVMEFFSAGWDSIKSDVRNVFSGGRTGREGQAAATDAGRVGREIADEIRKLQNTPIGASDLPAGGGRSSGGATESEADKKKRLAAAAKAAREAERARLDALRDEQAYNRELSRTRNDAAAAQAELAGNIEEQARIAKARLDDEAAEYADDIRSRQSQGRFGSGDVAQKRADELIKARNASIKAEKDAIDQRLRREQIQRTNDIASSDADIERERLRDEEQMATTRKARLKAQIDILNIELDERERILKAQLATETDEGKRAAIQRQIDAIPDVRRRGIVSTERQNEGALDAYVRGLTDVDNEQLAEEFVVDRLRDVQDGITGALQKAIGTKDPIIASLLNLLVQNVIMKPLAQALQSANGGAGGGGIGGILSSIGSLFGGGSAPARASGGNVVAGKMYRVNDGGRGVEGFRPAQSGTIIPLGRMTATRSGGVTVNQTVKVDARNSVNPDGFARDILSVSNAQAQRAGAASYAQGQQSAPGTINKYSQLRG